MNKARKYLGKNLENVKLWNDGQNSKAQSQHNNKNTKRRDMKGSNYNFTIYQIHYYLKLN